MVRSRLRSVTEPIRECTPEPPAVEVPSVGDRLPDRDALGRAGTLLAAAGAVLALAGALVRYLSGRGDEDSEEDADVATEPGDEAVPGDESPPEPHTWDWEGPRIAPLVGFVAVVVMRLYVESLGEETGE